MKYSARILLNGQFYGYLSVRDKSEWKTKKVAEKHAAEFCQQNSKQGYNYSFIIEAD